MRLTVLRELPRSVAELPAHELAGALGGPTLFDLRRGSSAPPLFLSVLLHGDEVTGWQAVRHVRDALARASALLFVGNVAAAARNMRMLPGQPDFNRVWEGGDGAEAAVADAVAAQVADAAPRLAIDVHNNSGDNPPYAVIARTDARTLAAAAAFSRNAIVATAPRGVQTMRLARFCPAVTIEAGKPDDARSTPRVVRYIAHLLDAARPASAHPLPRHPPALFETAARLLIDETGGEAVLEPGIQRFNFGIAPQGAALLRAGRLVAVDARGADVTERYLETAGAATVLKRPTTIAMYTDNLASARLDCLCYLLRRRPQEQNAVAETGRTEEENA